jgi:uncharacterized membrane-anchored protein
MTKNRKLILPAVVLGVVLLAVGVVYLIDDAGSLPSFFPGHQAGSTHHHAKHAIAAFVVGVLCFVLAWFQTGPARSTAVQ